VSPSKLAGEVERGEEEFVEVVREQAMEFGRVVHEALERMGTDVITRSALSDTDKKRATQMVEGALRSDLLKCAQRAGQVYRELPFTLMTDDGLMEGKIDLLFCERGKWVLVDYKTDARPEPERYREQMRAYQQALHHVAGLTAVEPLLFFLATGEVVNL
jgi:ATP-dependent exoDNAse (exonuclease V) beta subunit